MSLAKPSSTLGATAGIGLRTPHYAYIEEHKPSIPWFEVHSENFMMPGGLFRHKLEAIRQNYPISLHGVSLSLGSADGLDLKHLQKLKALIDWIDPCLVSEHLSWSRFGKNYLPDLLPLPYTKETLALVSDAIHRAQDFLGRQLLIENPSTYLEYNHSTYSEAAFLTEVTQKTGAGILLDVNNIYVSSHNHGFDPSNYFAEIPSHLVQEIHLGGHSQQDNGPLLIDTHNSKVCPQVWALYQQAIHYLGPIPTLIEWDTDLPAFEVLESEADKAQQILNRSLGYQEDFYAATC